MCTRFNSKLVRLKDIELSNPDEAVKMFQFQIGAIKRKWRAYLSRVL